MGVEHEAAGRRPNVLLRRARLRMPSPVDSRYAMSRQELAEAVNAHVFDVSGRVSVMDAHYVGRLERGIRRYPTADYRAAFRAVLGVATDAELGFVHPGRTLVLLPSGRQLTGSAGREPVEGSATQLVVAPGMAVVVVPADHPLLLALVDGQG
jgi:hypothetical protein